MLCEGLECGDAMIANAKRLCLVSCLFASCQQKSQCVCKDDIFTRNEHVWSRVCLLVVGRSHAGKGDTRGASCTISHTERPNPKEGHSGTNISHGSRARDCRSARPETSPAGIGFYGGWRSGRSASGHRRGQRGGAGSASPRKDAPNRRPGCALPIRSRESGSGGHVPFP